MEFKKEDGDVGAVGVGGGGREGKRVGWRNGWREGVVKRREGSGEAWELRMFWALHPGELSSRERETERERERERS